MGIILGATLLAPMAVFLDYHSYYITQFVASERVGGNYIDDDQVQFLPPSPGDFHPIQPVPVKAFGATSILYMVYVVQKNTFTHIL